MAAPQVSSHNPFRTPAATPNPTGHSTEPSTVSPSAANPPALPARPVSAHSENNSTTDSAVDSTGLSEELPPAYTPSADTRHGEATVEYGPRRPFQQPPSLPPHHVRPNHTGPMATLWSQLTGQAPIATASSGWSGYPGHRPVQPNHSGLRNAAQSSSHLQVPMPPSSATSEFARDFYTAGSEPNLTHSAPTSPGTYSPPPGPPPTSSSASNPGDRQPTSVPKPGHPLLKDGKLLVYPKGYECTKCMNLGYKRMDPSHPCKGCWSKFAKSFQGPLVTTYTNQSSSPSSFTFQRPLPTFNPPQRTTSPAPRPRSFPSVAPTSYVPPPQHPNIQIRALPPHGPPPPRNAVVYRAGDPRIGGRICWRCDGTGSVSLFLFDSTTCFECGGVGRVFR